MGSAKSVPWWQTCFSPDSLLRKGGVEGWVGVDLPSLFSLCKLLLTQAWREQNTLLGIHTFLKVHLKRCPCLLLQRGAVCALVLLVPRKLGHTGLSGDEQSCRHSEPHAESACLQGLFPQIPWILTIQSCLPVCLPSPTPRVPGCCLARPPQD